MLTTPCSNNACMCVIFKRDIRFTTKKPMMNAVRMKRHGSCQTGLSHLVGWMSLSVGQKPTGHNLTEKVVFRAKPHTADTSVLIGFQRPSTPQGHPRTNCRQGWREGESPSENWHTPNFQSRQICTGESGTRKVGKLPR